jgi:hypothetical protein
MGKPTKQQGSAMAHAVARIYSGSTAAEELAGIALKELARISHTDE